MALNYPPPYNSWVRPFFRANEEVSYFGYLKILYHHSGVVQIFEPSTEVTVTGGGIKVAITNFNDQGYCSIGMVRV